MWTNSNLAVWAETFQQLWERTSTVDGDTENHFIKQRSKKRQRYRICNFLPIHIIIVVLPNKWSVNLICSCAPGSKAELKRTCLFQVRKSLTWNRRVLLSSALSPKLSSSHQRDEFGRDRERRTSQTAFAACTWKKKKKKRIYSVVSQKLNILFGVTICTSLNIYIPFIAFLVNQIPVKREKNR